MIRFKVILSLNFPYKNYSGKLVKTGKFLPVSIPIKACKSVGLGRFGKRFWNILFEHYPGMKYQNLRGPNIAMNIMLDKPTSYWDELLFIYLFYLYVCLTDFAGKRRRR